MPIGIKGFQKSHPAFRSKTRINKKCLFCNKDIFVSPYLQRIGSGKFCNAECYAKWQSENRVFEKNYSWKGGSEHTYRCHARRIIKKHNIPQICSFCGAAKHIIIHHKDKNVKNNALSNLQPLCSSCHVNLHYKLSKKTKQDRAKKFTCCICQRTFYVNTNHNRKVCGTTCSYVYSKERGLWFTKNDPRWRKNANIGQGSNNKNN